LVKDFLIILLSEVEVVLASVGLAFVIIESSEQQAMLKNP
jgi:NADH:ubiquinone oxidoreductase subunit K